MSGPRLYISFLAVFFLCLHSDAVPVDTASHRVTVSAQPIAVLSLAGGSGANTARLVVDSNGITTEGHGLQWTTNLDGMRVTVESNLPSNRQGFVLRVRAVDLETNGTSGNWVMIKNTPSDLVTGISRETGGCSIDYDVLSKKGNKAERDEHIITYTITE